METNNLRSYHGIAASVLVLFILIISPPYLSGLGIWGYLVGELLIILPPLIVVKLTRTDPKLCVPFALPPVRKFFASVGMYIGSLMLSASVRLITSKLIPDCSARTDALDEAVRSINPVLAIILFAAVPAICEEIFCRGFLSAAFAKIKNKWATALLIGFIFGVMHNDLYVFFPTFITGTLLAVIALDTGSLLIPILIHFANNAIAVVGAYGNAGAEQGTGIDSFNNVQTAGAVIFYLGIATVILYLSISVFFGKKLKKKALIAVIIIASVLTMVGNTVTGIGSMEIVESKIVSYEYGAEGLNKEVHNFHLEKGTYAITAVVQSEDPVEVLLVKGEKTVFKSSASTRHQINRVVELDEGVYTLTIITEDGKELDYGEANISFIVVKYLL